MAVMFAWFCIGLIVGGGGIWATLKAIMKGLLWIALIIVVITALIVIHVTHTVSRIGESINTEVSGWSLGGLLSSGLLLSVAVFAAIAVGWKVYSERRETHAALTAPDALLTRLQAEEESIIMLGEEATDQDMWRLQEIQHDITQLYRGNRPDYH